MKIKVFCRCRFFLPSRAKDLSAPMYVACLPLPLFLLYFTNGANFGMELLNIKYVYSFLYNIF